MTYLCLCRCQVNSPSLQRAPQLPPTQLARPIAVRLLELPAHGGGVRQAPAAHQATKHVQQLALRRRSSLVLPPHLLQPPLELGEAHDAVTVGVEVLEHAVELLARAYEADERTKGPKLKV